jgi:4-amino-4-deoxy-L-arabinose transferase
VFRIGELAFNRLTGYIGAALVAFSYYTLELTSGAIGMDHNDVAFGAYLTASVWAYYEYRRGRQKRWLIAVALFAGCAVLCKWLAGMVVYGGWGLDILLNSERRRDILEYRNLLLSAAVATAIVLPWQVYIHAKFPVESAYELFYNSLHLTKALEGHSGDWTFHFGMLPFHYGPAVLGLIIIGIILALRQYRTTVVPLVAICAAIFLLFTFAATKMASYTFVSSSFLFLFAAVPVSKIYEILESRFAKKTAAVAIYSLLLLLVWLNARPALIYSLHFEDSSNGLVGPLNRKARASNVRVYKALNSEVPPGTVVFNANEDDEVAAMFYSDRNVYSKLPSPEEWNALKAKNLKLAIFPARPEQELPDYITQTQGLTVIWGMIQ